jgi:hypothetical protein
MLKNALFRYRFVILVQTIVAARVRSHAFV